MKLVEGGSLAGKVPQLVEHPRQAAQLVATVAQAVHSPTSAASSTAT